MNGIEKAIKFAGGNQSELARMLGTARMNVSNWYRDGIVPVKRVRQVSELTGVPFHELNPEYYPKPKSTRRKK